MAEQENDQNYTIDINKIYSDFIQEIDKVRSFVNISASNNQQILNVLDEQAITELNKKLKIEETVQESRCHAFYRMIGFPVVSDAGTFYNPGLDNIRDMSQEDKIKIAKKPIPKFNKLSLERETYVSSVRNVFDFNTSIEASTVALSSSTSIRKFAAPVEQINTASSSTSDGTGVFSTDADQQSFQLDLKSKVGDFDVYLTEYKDVSGSNPATDILTNKRKHIILPFIVDARIDFSVSPSKNKIAIPFTYNKSNTKIDDNNFVNRPLLEKVIRDRFAVTNQFDKIGTANQDIFKKIQSNPNFKDVSIVKNISNINNYRLAEQLQFLQFFNIIKAMMIKLWDAKRKIDAAKKLYYYLPIPSKIGPEGGCTIQNVISSINFGIDETGKDLITTADQNILSTSIAVTIEQINAQAANADAVQDTGGFAFDAFKTTFTPETTDSIVNISSGNLKELTDKRDSCLKQANEALKTFEIIMGDFSGLGLCDIIAIMASLYVMPKEALIGFLDDTAYERMVKMSKNLGFSKSPPAKGTVSNSMLILTNNVKDFYNLMDKTYIDVQQNNGK